MSPKVIFGTDGWRARIGEEFTFDAVRACAQGVAEWVIGVVAWLGRADLSRLGGRERAVTVAAIADGRLIHALEDEDAAALA